MQERRGGPRAQFDGWVEIASKTRRRRGAGSDLSAGGIGLVLSPPLPEQATPVTTEFTLPGISLPLSLEGVVAWRDPERRRLGLRFEEVDAGLAELLASYVSGRL